MPARITVRDGHAGDAAALCGLVTPLARHLLDAGPGTAPCTHPLLATFTAVKDAGNIVISVPGIVSGSSYTVRVDDSDAGSVTADQASAGGGMGRAGDQSWQR